MNHKTDRRVKYTKTALREALVTLMQDRHISQITVKALCDLADVNRSTFYAHYTDPYDLLGQVEAGGAGKPAPVSENPADGRAAAGFRTGADPHFWTM